MSSGDTLAALRERHGPRYRWLLLLSVMVGTMASIMSSTIVNGRARSTSYGCSVARPG